MKSIIINQFFGLGDILFIEPIYRHYHNLGYQVIAPVEDHYYWIKDYIPYVDFRKKSEFKMDYEQTDLLYTFEGIPVLPLRFAHPLLRGYEPHYGDDRPNWMLDKYKWLGLLLDTWQGLTFKRNVEKENELCELLGLVSLKPFTYTFGNRNYGGGFAEVKEVPECDIMMRKIDGFTMLDWGKVIEHASEIHTVETSVLYMIEALPCKAKSFNLYPRIPWEYYPHGVSNFINTKKWKLHDCSHLR